MITQLNNECLLEMLPQIRTPPNLSYDDLMFISANRAICA
jgi:hypothetical protein